LESRNGPSESLLQASDHEVERLLRETQERHHAPGGDPSSLNRLAFAATWHCLTGCAIGEVLGLAVATALGWGNVASIALAVVLAFSFGYALTLRPLLRSGVPLRRAARVALAADTVSITIMEIVDNAFILLVPGAMEAGLSDFLFWWSLAVGLAIAFIAAFPVNRYLIARGRGHAVVHSFH
jgi:Domain of unknown function (DUF4396)